MGGGIKGPIFYRDMWAYSLHLQWLTFRYWAILVNLRLSFANRKNQINTHPPVMATSGMNIVKAFIILASFAWVVMAIPLYTTIPASYQRIASGTFLSDFGAIYGSLGVYWQAGGNPFSMPDVQRYMVSMGGKGFLPSPFFYSPLTWGHYMLVPIVVLLHRSLNKGLLQSWVLCVAALLFGALILSTGLNNFYEYPDARSLSINFGWVLLTSLSTCMVLLALCLSLCNETSLSTNTWPSDSNSWYAQALLKLKANLLKPAPDYPH